MSLSTPTSGLKSPTGPCLAEGLEVLAEGRAQERVHGVAAELLEGGVDGAALRREQLHRLPQHAQEVGGGVVERVDVLPHVERGLAHLRLAAGPTERMHRRDERVEERAAQRVALGGALDAQLELRRVEHLGLELLALASAPRCGRPTGSVSSVELAAAGATPSGHSSFTHAARCTGVAGRRCFLRNASSAALSSSPRWKRASRSRWRALSTSASSALGMRRSIFEGGVISCVHHRLQRLGVGLPLEQPPRAQRLPEHHAQAEDVAARVEVLVVGLLRRHVRVLALDDAGGGAR